MPPGRPSGLVPLSWPFGARTEQVRIVESWITDPHIAGGVVSGAAGVGKTRVVSEALAGPNTRWVVGTSAARAIPLGAFAAWAGAETEKVHLVRGVIESLCAGKPGAQLCLVVDDAHLVDDLSVFVVHQLVQRHLAKVILIIREGESISAAIHELIKVSPFDRLGLRPLTLDETAHLLPTVLTGIVDPAAVQRLWMLTSGNLLYLRTVVEQEIHDGRLVQQEGVWRWTGEPVLPPDLIGLIELQMGELPSGTADVVDALAVAEPLELRLLQRITDPASVEEAECRNLIALESASGKIHARVAHPLYAEVRRRRAAGTRLRRLRGKIATELAATPDADEVRTLIKRATLSLESDLPADSDLLVRAAHGAVWLADLPLAVRLAVAAGDAGAGSESSFVRAHALSWLGRGEGAEAVLNSITTGELTDIDRARLAFLRASNALWALGDPQGALRIVDDASEVTAAQAHHYLDAFRTVHAFATDQPHDARLVAERLQLDEMPAVVGAEVAWALTVVTGDSGRTTEAVANAGAGYRTATRQFDAPQMRFNIADAHLSALWLAGRLAEAAELADTVRRQAADLPGDAQLLGAAVAGRAALGAGQIASAAALLEHGVVGLCASGHSLGWGYRYQVPRVTAMAMRGSSVEAVAVMGELDRKRRPFRQLDYEISLARAWVAASQGAVSEATGCLLAAARRAGARGKFAAEVLLLQTATQFGDRSCAARLAELATLVEGPRAGLAARLAAAAHDFAGSELASLSADYEQLGDLVAALDAAALGALAYRRNDQRGSALGCSTRAAALAARCDGLVTPALRQANTDLPLTDREIEIAMLIGQGLTNRAVAERLTLSVRTIESHIYRAMAKTGVTSREELATLLNHRTL